MLRVAEHAERTDTGRQRSGNEDAFFARAPLFAIADGMGGAQAGEVASRTAVEVLEQGLPGAGSVEERLAQVAQDANDRIHGLSIADDAHAGMGTTLTALHVGEHEITVVHVGDSRLYRLRDGQLERLTTDHTLVEELIRQGRLRPEEAEDHPQRSIITRALGPEAIVLADTHTFPARAGDVYLVCSDGLTGMVAEDEIAHVLLDTPTLATAARTLVRMANDAGGRDNITVVLLRLEEIDLGAGTADDATRVGDAALHAADVQTALSQRGTAELAVPPPPPAPVSPRREPRPGGGDQTPAPAGRRRRLRVRPAWIAGLVVTFIFLASAYLASQAVYFVGTDSDGFVTIYRGVPYELPAGVDLYQQHYVSGVSAVQLTARQRRTVLDNQLRSREDADDLVRQLELGRLGGA